MQVTLVRDQCLRKRSDVGDVRRAALHLSASDADVAIALGEDFQRAAIRKPVEASLHTADVTYADYPKAFARWRHLRVGCSRIDKFLRPRLKLASLRIAAIIEVESDHSRATGKHEADAITTTLIQRGDGLGVGCPC